MAVLFIAEYAALHVQRGDPTAVLPDPPVAEQTVAIGGTSAQSAAFGDTTRIIRVHTDAICSVLVGADPEAAATNKRMAAGQTEYLAVQPGHKIAVITNT